MVWPSYNRQQDEILLLQLAMIRHINRKICHLHKSKQSSRRPSRFPITSLQLSSLGDKFVLSSHNRGNTSAKYAQEFGDHFGMQTCQFEQLSFCREGLIACNVLCSFNISEALRFYKYRSWHFR